MKSLDFVVQDPCGLHARPAGVLANFAREHTDAAITVQAKGKCVNLADIMPLLSLRLRCGDSITFRVEGSDEENISQKLKALLESTL